MWCQFVKCTLVLEKAAMVVYRDCVADFRLTLATREDDDDTMGGGSNAAALRMAVTTSGTSHAGSGTCKVMLTCVVCRCLRGCIRALFFVCYAFAFINLRV